MTNDPEYVLMFEDLTTADDRMAANSRPDMKSSQRDSLEMEVEPQPVAVAAQYVQTEPVTESTRTAPDLAEIDRIEPRAVAADGRLTSPAPGVGATAEQPADGLSRNQLLKRAVKMFCGGRQQLVASGGDTLVSEVNLELITTVKAVVTDVFKDYAANICSSPEKPECRLSQEEALGHLIGSLVVGEMLVPEARPVGKRLDFHAGKEAKAVKAEKERLREKKKSLRKKKGLGPEELASLCEAADRILVRTW